MHPSQEDIASMSSVATFEGYVRQDAAIRGLTIKEARTVIARDAGLSPGTLENLARGRLKNVRYIEDKIRAYVIRRLEREIQQLEHELAIARLASYRPDDSDILEAQAALEKARALIGR